MKYIPLWKKQNRSSGDPLANATVYMIMAAGSLLVSGIWLIFSCSVLDTSFKTKTYLLYNISFYETWKEVEVGKDIGVTMKNHTIAGTLQCANKTDSYQVHYLFRTIQAERVCYNCSKYPNTRVYENFRCQVRRNEYNWRKLFNITWEQTELFLEPQLHYQVLKYWDRKVHVNGKLVVFEPWQAVQFDLLVTRTQAEELNQFVVSPLLVTTSLLWLVYAVRLCTKVKRGQTSGTSDSGTDERPF